MVTLFYVRVQFHSVFLFSVSFNLILCVREVVLRRVLVSFVQSSVSVEVEGEASIVSFAKRTNKLRR